MRLNEAEQFETSARYVALILDGKSPADLPVVLHGTFAWSSNLRTLRAIGIEPAGAAGLNRCFHP